MLYCPKCHQTYDDGSQRFCTNEGARLLPSPTSEGSGQTKKGVFTNILSKTKPQVLDPQDHAAKSAQEDEAGFEMPSESKFFTPDQSEFELDMAPAGEEPVGVDKSPDQDSFEPLPLALIFNPLEIPERHSGHDQLEDVLETDQASEPGRTARDAAEVDPNFELSLSGLGADDAKRGASKFARVGQKSRFELELGEPVSPTAEIGKSESILDLDPPDRGVATAADGDVFQLDLTEDPDGPSVAGVSTATGLSEIELDLEGLVDPSDRTPGDAGHEASGTGNVIRLKKRDESTGRQVVLEPIRRPKAVTASVDEIVIGSIDEAVPQAAAVAATPAGDTTNWWLLPLLGLVVIAIGLGLWYLVGTSEGPVAGNSAGGAVNTGVSENVVNSIVPEESITPPGNYSMGSEFKEPVRMDAPPPPRVVKQPPNTVKFRNEKRNQRGRTATKFLGFSVFYPKDWKNNKSDSKFLDISRSTRDGLIEQILIEPYDSLGTFSADASIFEDLVRQSNEDLRKILPNFQVISQRETTIQMGRWRAYEVKFQGGGSTSDGAGRLIVWGRRLWIPVQKEGMKSGFIITMLVTSLSPQVKSVDDVGEVGALATILETFEPDLN